MGTPFVFQSTPSGKPNIILDLWRHGEILDNGEIIIEWEVDGNLTETAWRMTRELLGKGCVIIDWEEES